MPKKKNPARTREVVEARRGLIKARVRRPDQLSNRARKERREAEREFLLAVNEARGRGRTLYKRPAKTKKQRRIKTMPRKKK